MKRGQIATFIIMGLIVVIGGVLVLLAIEPSSEPTLSEDQLPVHSFVQSCLEQVSEEAVLTHGIMGGIEDEDSQTGIAIYYDASSGTHLPTLQAMENHLARMIEEGLVECTGTFEELSAQGYFIEKQGPTVRISLRKQTSITLTYPLTIRKGTEDLTKMSDFTHMVPIDFQRMYTFLTDLLAQQDITENAIPSGYLAIRAQQTGIVYSTTHIEPSLVLFSFTTEETIGKVPYIFQYVAQYNWEESTNDLLLYNLEFPSLTCLASIPCSYNFNPHNRNWEFESYSDLFTIAADGKGHFTPTNNDGLVYVPVKITSGEDERYVSVEVIIQ